MPKPRRLRFLIILYGQLFRAWKTDELTCRPTPPPHPGYGADQFHNQDRINLAFDDAVPLTEPRWTYQAGDAGVQYLHHIITCLFLEGMLKSYHIHVNYDKIRAVTQENDENPAPFLSQLTEAVQKYTNLDISTPAGLLYLLI